MLHFKDAQGVCGSSRFWRAKNVQQQIARPAFMRGVFTLGLAALLAGCQSEPPAKPLTPAQSALRKPTDARLARVYEQSCKSCHTVADTGAPLTGDRTKWDVRWAKGEDALLTSAIQGLNGMPAGGQCFSCTPDDFRGLIRFMAGREK